MTAAHGPGHNSRVTVHLPRALLMLFPEAPGTVTVDATTVDEMMTALDARWPGMRDRLCDSSPQIRKHLSVFVDGRRARLDTRLAPGTAVHVLTAMSGG